MINNTFTLGDIITLATVLGVIAKLWYYIKTSSQKEQNLVNKVESLEKDLDKIIKETEKKFEQIENNIREERREIKEEINKLSVKQDQMYQFLITHLKETK